MNIQDIHLIFDYNYCANHRILAASAGLTKEQFLTPADFPYGSLRGTLVHILDAEWGWRGLFETLTFGPDLNRDDFPTIQTLEEHWGKEEKSMRAYLAKLKDEDMASHLKYTTDTGIKRDRILWHCLLHVVNHGTQHRSEAAAMLTSFGHSPGDLDFTVFLNETKP
jgi:uncharacterized damage-inducible protein DinB